MPNKFHRQNLRMGSNPFGRKSNLAKIMEVFGPKKKDKKVKKTKTTKRMFANKGGGADMGTMGEIKSKLAVAMDKIKRLENLKKPKSDSGMFNPETIEKLEKEKRKEFIKKFKEAGSPEFSKGGSAKKKKKFPDMSGDGKVTMKDILMARGVIPKKKKTKKKVI